MTFCALQYYCNVFAQFHGSGGLSKCEGTTQEEAVKNQMIRKMITDREEVKAYYEVFTLEDKDGKLTLDHLKAADHVRTVLNNRKRGSVQSVKVSYDLKPRLNITQH